MDHLLYLIAGALIRAVQRLPLRTVARLGRACGALAFWLDARHRRVARRNLTLCFGSEKSRHEIRALVKENFRRIGENFACAVKTASMTWEELQPHVQFVAPRGFFDAPPGQPPRNLIAAIGHFGNFELYARFSQYAPGYKSATTYRGLRQQSLDRLLQSLRQQSGCQFFERRFDGAALKDFMHQHGVILGLLSDQNGGERGLYLPFMGQPCSTSPAPALFALRYNCALFTGFCYRVGLAQWRIEAGAEIPTHENAVPRTTEAIMLDVNGAFEAAVRRDPANWFWVHNRWKNSGLRKPRAGAPLVARA